MKVERVRGAMKACGVILIMIKIGRYFAEYKFVIITFCM